jgi:hypothetical protein
MKHLLSIMVLLCATNLNAQLQAWVSLGRAQSCEGFGICRIETSPSAQAGIPCRIDLLRNGKLNISFSRSQLQDADYLRYFATGYFFVEQDILLPNDLRLGTAAQTIMIRKGRYPVYDEGTRLSLIL